MGKNISGEKACDEKNYLDNVVSFRTWVQGKLNVTFTDDTQVTDDSDGNFTEHVVSPVDIGKLLNQQVEGAGKKREEKRRERKRGNEDIKKRKEEKRKTKGERRKGKKKGERRKGKEEKRKEKEQKEQRRK